MPAPYVLTEDFNQLVPVPHGAQHLQQAVDAGRAALRQRPVGDDVRLPRAAAHGDRDGRRLARRLRDQARARSSRAAVAPAETPLKTATLPPGRQLTLPVTSTGDDIGVRAFFRSALGDYVAVGLGHTRAGHTVLLHGRVPFRHATLAQIRFDILNNGRTTANAGTGIQPSAKGTVSFGTLRVTARPCRCRTGSGPAASAAAGQARLHPHAGPGADLPPGAGDRRPAAAGARDAARREAAGPHGVIPIDVEGEQIAARIVGIVQRFPSIQGDAVVADLSQAATRLDTRSPGLGTPDELWVSGSTPPRAPSSPSPRAQTRSRGSGPIHSRAARC